MSESSKTMLLDWFFAATEMSNGLTSPSQVEELVSVMQKEKIENIGDAAKHLSAVSRALSATENQDCLLLFIQLDGLEIICKWLKDVKRFSNDDKSESSMEESFSHLVQAVEKLLLVDEKRASSELCDTIKDLLDNKSFSMQDKARGLLDSWKKDRGSNGSSANCERADDGVRTSLGTETEKECPESSASRDVVTSTGEGEIKESDKDESVPEPSFVENSKDQDSDLVLENPVGEDRVSDRVDSPSLPTSANEGNKVDASQDILDKEDVDELKSATGQKEDGLSVEEPALVDESRPLDEVELSVEEPASVEESKPEADGSLASASNAVDASNCVTEPIQELNDDIHELNDGIHELNDDIHELNDDIHELNDDVQVEESVPKDSSVVMECNQNDTSVVAHDLPTWERAFLLKSEIEGGGFKNLGLLVTDQTGVEEDTNRGMSKKPNTELDYGIFDPLEFARQVAIEVEREVGYSSDEKLPEVKSQQPESPDSVSGQKSHETEDSDDEEDQSGEASSPVQEDSTTTAENREPGNGVNEVCEMEDDAQQANPVKGFDLNLEFGSEEDTDLPISQVSTSVSIVSASRAVPVPGLPVSPLQFEGSLGWKGSAATSAFRRIPEGGDKNQNLSGGESISSSKQRDGSLDFDLNVSGTEDDRAGTVQDVQYSIIPSRESKTEAYSRPELDLNRLSEDGNGNGPSGLQTAARLFPGLTDIPSSSVVQPSLRHFDLNDQPAFLHESSDNSFLNKLSRNSSDNSVIIMGKRVEVKRKEPVPASANGRNPADSAFDLNLGRTTRSFLIGSSLPYQNHAVYSYNGIPPGHAVSYPSMMYAPGGPGRIPYMMDPRMVPVPQIVGPASGLPPGFHQQPVLVSMAGANPNVVGPSRTSLDLNSGSMLEAGNRGMGHIFSLGQGSSMDDQLRSNGQSSISSLSGGKRKEPESGWEHYPFRHHTPPWR